MFKVYGDEIKNESISEVDGGGNVQGLRVKYIVRTVLKEILRKKNRRLK